MIFDLANKITGFPINMMEGIYKWVINKKNNYNKVKPISGLEEIKGPIKDGKLTTVFESNYGKRGNTPPYPPKDRRSPYYNSGNSGTSGYSGASGTSGNGRPFIKVPPNKSRW